MERNFSLEFRKQVKDTLIEIQRETKPNIKLKKAAIFALSILNEEDCLDLSIIAQELLQQDNEEIVGIVLSLASQKKNLPYAIIRGLSNILISNFSDESKCNSSLALSLIVEYQKLNEIKEIVEGDVLRNLVAALKTSKFSHELHRKVKNNILSTLCEMTISKLPQLWQQEIVDQAVNHLKKEQTSFNSSALIEQLCENYISTSSQQHLQKRIPEIIQYFILVNQKAEVKENLIKGLAILAKNNFKFQLKEIELLSSMIKVGEKVRINNATISLLGNLAKVNIVFNKQTILNYSNY